MDTVILLYRVLKGLPIAEAAIARLRREGSIEGCKPNLHVSARIAAATETEVSYTRKKGMEKSQLKQFVIAHLARFGGLQRDKLEALIVPMLSADLTEKQKQDRVKNLLSEMRREQSIAPDKQSRGAVWSVVGKQTSKGSAD